MAHTGANAAGHETIMRMVGANLRQTAKLLPTEVRSGAGIDEDSDGKEEDGREPGPRS